MPKKLPKPIAPYLADLDSADYKVRREAVKGLRQSGNPDAFPYLLAALKDPNVSVLIHAIRAMQEFGDPRAIPALIAMIGVKSVCDVCDEVGAALVSFGEAAVPALIENLKSPHGRARALSVICLNRIGDPAAVEPILALLEDDDSGVIGAVNTALWDFKDERAREPLAAFLARPDDAIPHNPMTPVFQRRLGAAFALAELGDPRAIDILAQSFDHSATVAFAAIQQLGKINDPRVRPLLQRYIDADPDSLRASQARAALEHVSARE